MTFLVYAAFILAVIPLISVIWTVLANGIPGLTSNMLFTSMNGVTGFHDNQADAPSQVMGGAYHAPVQNQGFRISSARAGNQSEYPQHQDVAYGEKDAKDKCKTQ